MQQATITKYQAIASVEDANALFCKAAKEVLLVVARYKQWFTTDDLWRFLKKGRGVEPRAMGAVLEWARRKEVIERTEYTRISKRRECHRRSVRVWRSNIVGVKL